jgi:hypothetical protein
VVKIGEKHSCDWFCYRSVPKRAEAPEFFQWEAKAPGKRPDADQLEYIRRQQAIGFLCEWFDGYDSGAKDFKWWYQAHFK